MNKKYILMLILLNKSYFVDFSQLIQKFFGNQGTLLSTSIFLSSTWQLCAVPFFTAETGEGFKNIKKSFHELSLIDNDDLHGSVKLYIRSCKIFILFKLLNIFFVKKPRGK